MINDIYRNGIIYHGVLCPHCGTKVYPPESLQPHLDRHELRDLMAKGWMRHIIRYFSTMRDFKEWME